MARWIDKLAERFGYVKPEPQKDLLGEIQKTAAMLAQGNDPVAPKAGRSSVEETATSFGQMGLFLQDLAGLNPVLPFDLVEWLTRVAPINPDLNHATTNLINLANNGHQLVVEAASDSIVEKAHARLNDRAQNLYPMSAGIDGLINHYIEQIAVTGAISSEDVVSEKMDGVDRVVIVPTDRIRFKLIDGGYKPFQLLMTGEMLELNETQYRYFAFRRIKNSPYAVPLYVAAIEPLLAQRDMNENIKFVMRKFGLLGLVAMTLTPPPKKAAESDKEYSDRKGQYLTAVVTALQVNYMRGLMVKFSDQTVEHHNITSDARGSKDVWDLNEEQIASGMGIDPTIIGRSYHSTETFANVTYMFMIRQANNIRSLPKRRMEATYNLDLRLQGIQVERVIFKFNDNPARDPLSEAQAQETRQRAIIEKARTGVIDPDTAAQELGYDSWFEVERLNGERDGQSGLGGRGGLVRVFRYDRGLQRYSFVRPRIEIQLTAEETVRRVLEKWGAKYLKSIQPFLKDSTMEAVDVLAAFLRRSALRDFSGPEDFAQRAFGVMTSAYAEAFTSKEAQEALKKSVEQIYEYYRTEDRSAIPAGKFTFTMDSVDRRTVQFMRRFDRLYLSKYIFNEPTENQVLDFLKSQWLEKGEGLFGRTSREALDTFKSLAVDRLVPLSDYEAQRIIDTSVARMRNWAHVGQLNEAGFKEAMIYNPAPQAEICIYMTGTRIKVAVAQEAVEKLSALSPEEYAKGLAPITSEVIRSIGVTEATRQGIGFPPFHPNCKTRLVAVEG